MSFADCFARASMLLTLVAWPALAQDYDMMKDKWRVYVGGLRATVDSTIRINGEVLPPVPPVDLENVLGVERSRTVAWGGASWQFARRHTIEAEFFQLNRSASITRPFDPPVQIGDTIIESGSIGTGYDTSVYRLTYGFSALRNERSEFKLKGGIHYASLQAGIGISGAICNPTTTPSTPPGCPPLGTSVESEDVSAPLPHLGVSYSYMLTPTLGLKVEAIGFALELDNIDGSILELDTDIAWQPFRHLGFGLGYRYFDVDVKSGGSELNGQFEFQYHGPVVYVQTTF